VTFGIILMTSAAMIKPGASFAVLRSGTEVAAAVLQCVVETRIEIKHTHAVQPRLQTAECGVRSVECLSIVYTTLERATPLRLP